MTLPALINKRVIILTGEPSGDAHAAPLIRELKKKEPGLRVSGIGGPCLSREGVRLFYDIKELTVMGAVEVLYQFSHIKRAFARFKLEVHQHRPDLLILVDYPGFNLKAAAWAKTFHIPVLYYITPKVWAWKKSRLKTIRKWVDHAALIFPFELPLYKRSGIPATFVGNPLLDQFSVSRIASQSVLPRTKHGTGSKTADDFVIGLLPGSRKNEIHSLLETMLAASCLIKKQCQTVRFVVSAAESADLSYIRGMIDTYEKQIPVSIKKGSVSNIFSQADLLIAASGTVTLEAAIHGIPTIIIYKVSPLTFFLGKRFVRLDYVGLPNIIAKKEVMPELLQDKANPVQISDRAIEMMQPANLHQSRKELRFVKHMLGTPGAARRTAQIAMNLLN
ncbi:MAG: lipid-A-disaccharide synthase [Desulfobacteraceae bacterium]|nr:MAG: lipid-A-disaccharide synthase [Desulfobacteraceae bacterium]